MSNDETYPIPGGGVVVLFCLRHGRTILNVGTKENPSGFFRGQANPPLAESGIHDAHKLATFFEPYALSFIISSDKIRATTTANIIGARKGITPIQSEGLRAFNVGEFSGKPRNKENVDEFERYINNPGLQIPGGESLNDFKARIRPCIGEAVETSDKAGVPGMLVAHSSIIHEIGDMLYGDHKLILVEPGGAIAVFYRDGRLEAQPIYKPLIPQPSARAADTVS